MTTVLQAIAAATNDPRVQQAMALGAGLEGGNLGSGPFPVGDNGTSFGPYQIHKSGTLHADITAQQAADPAAATSYMVGEYTGAVNRVPSSLWASDPEKAAERAAYLAERPAVDYYDGRGAGAVDAAWNAASSGLKTGKPSGGGFWSDAGTVLSNVPILGLPFSGLGSDAAGAVAGVAGDAASSAATAVAGAVLPGLGKLLLYGSAVLIGGGLVVAGLYTTVSNTAPARAAKNATSTAATAAAVL